MKTMININKNKKKTFLNKFLLATSSIGLLVSMEAFAASTIVPVGNPSSNINNNLDWKHNGVNRLPQLNDNIILKENLQRINLNTTIDLDNVNLFGYDNSEFTITANAAPNKISIGNIVNNTDNAAKVLVQNALGVANHPVGNNINPKTKFTLAAGNGSYSQLTIKGNNISALGFIVIQGGSRLIFENDVTLDAMIDTNGGYKGILEIKGKVIFTKVVGQIGKTVDSIVIDNTKSLTLQSNIHSRVIGLVDKDSTLIVDPSRQNIEIRSDVASDALLGMNDGDGKIRVKGNINNTVVFYNQIGEHTEIQAGRRNHNRRVGEINIESGKKTEFNNTVDAKKIIVALNDVEFKEKLEMERYSRNIGGVTDGGNLEFTDKGKVKFYKDFTGDITTTKDLQGTAIFKETENIYKIGAVDKRLERVQFEGNHLHKLYQDIHARQVIFDSGTYNIHDNNVRINGDAIINGSTFSLQHHLSFSGDVIFSGNITLNAANGRNIMIFENNAPRATNGTSIVFNVGGVHPADAQAALALLQVNGAAFNPARQNYDAGTGTLTWAADLPAAAAAAPVAPAPVAPAPAAAVPAPVAPAAAAAVPVPAAPAPVVPAAAAAAAPAAAVPAPAPVAAVPAPVAPAPVVPAAAAAVPAPAPVVPAAAPVAPAPAAAAAAAVPAPVAPAPVVPAAAPVVPAAAAAAAPVVPAAAAAAVPAPVAPAPVVPAAAAAAAPAAAVPAPAPVVPAAAPVAPAPVVPAAAAAVPVPAAPVAAPAAAAPVAPAPALVAPAPAPVAPAPAAAVPVPAAPAPVAAVPAPVVPAAAAVPAPAAAQALQPQVQQQQGQQQEEDRRAEQRMLQEEANQRRIAEEQRVIAEYARKPESQKLSEAIANIIVGSTKNTIVTEAQKELKKEKATFIIKNHENVVEVAQELASNKVELAEAAKVGSDDKAIAGKTKEDQSLLFAAVVAQNSGGKEKEAVKHIADQGTRSISVASITPEAVSSNINNHFAASNMVAVAAGDEDNGIITKEAVWVAGTFGSSHQNEYKGNAGYDGKVAGGTIGADLYMGDDNLVGIAYSRMNSDFKFKGSDKGDSLKADSNVISLYGQQQFGGGFLLQEILSFSDSKITKKDVRLGGKIAQGKYTSKAYAAEANIGYQFAAISSINLTPNIGIRYNNYKDESFTETGTGAGNIYTPAKSGNLVTGIAGVKVTAPQQLSNDLQIIPGLHGSVENSFSNKQPNVKARFVWADSYFENNSATKMPKTAYNIGASVLAKHKSVELLATYNCNLRSKYQSHQGSLKLKLLF